MVLNHWACKFVHWTWYGPNLHRTQLHSNSQVSSSSTRQCARLLDRERGKEQVRYEGRLRQVLGLSILCSVARAGAVRRSHPGSHRSFLDLFTGKSHVKACNFLLSRQNSFIVGSRSIVRFAWCCFIEMRRRHQVSIACLSISGRSFQILVLIVLLYVAIWPVCITGSCTCGLRINTSRCSRTLSNRDFCPYCTALGNSSRLRVFDIST